jgi:hypothetical protein
MSNVAKKLLLSLGVASLLIGCRSEFGYNSGNGKSPGKSPSSPTFRIGADKLTANIKGYPDSAVNFTAYCNLSGSKVIDWDMGDGTKLRGEKVTHEFSLRKAHVVKAVCRGSKTLSASLTINAVVPGENTYPGQYPNQNPTKGTKGTNGTTDKGGDPIYDNYDIPTQPRWQPEYSYPGTNNQYPSKY